MSIGPKSDYMRLADPIDRRRVSSNAASKTSTFVAARNNAARPVR
jgi:hypothetical protein